MAKTRKRQQKTVRLLPAFAELIEEITNVERDYRFLTESEVLESAVQLGALVLAAQVYGSSRTLETISREQVVGELRVRLLPALELLYAHDQAPTLMSAGSTSEPASTIPPEPPSPIDAAAGGMIQSFGGSFLDDDE